MDSFEDVKKPVWKDPYTPGTFTESGGELKFLRELDTQVMVENFSRMARAAEDELYIKLITEVLATKGYEVRKVET